MGNSSSCNFVPAWNRAFAVAAVDDTVVGGSGMQRRGVTSWPDDVSAVGGLGGQCAGAAAGSNRGLWNQTRNPHVGLGHGAQ